MASSKEIRNRIKSATSTKQVIKAMELVSVVKMQKAIATDLASRPYADAANSILKTLSEGVDIASHPLMVARDGKRKLIILMTSDKGLAGSLNAKATKQAVEEAKNAEEAAFITVGKKGRDLVRSLGYKVIADFVKIGDRPDFIKVLPIINIALEEFTKENFDSVVMVYPKFISTLTQEPTTELLLPFKTLKSKEESDDLITFEPDKEALLKDLVSRIIETKVWHALVETTASEHSARMIAMKNANDNAEDLIFDLTLSYNQTRQAGITREIAEISAGKMILEE